jgi:hypothetical protein
MKDDSVLSQFTGRLVHSKPEPDAKPDVEAGLEDNLGAFGILRGIRDRAVMLELRLRDGSAKSLGYSWLEEADFNASGAITLKFGGKSVRIIGRNLNAEVRANVRLFDSLCRHRVPWIREADELSAMRADRRAMVVERIEFD